MGVELTPEERAVLERRIDCPVPWCMGSWLEHGGDGQAPEKWFHEEAIPTALGYGATISRSQEGSDPIVWSFAMDRHGIATVQDPSELVQMLRRLATAVEALGD